VTRWLAAAALAGVLITASCGGGVGAESDAAGLESLPADVLFTGVARPLAVGSPPSLEVTAVHWQRGAHHDSAGVLVIPDKLAPGEVVDLDASLELLAGQDYVVIARRTGAGDGHVAVETLGVLDGASRAVVHPFRPTPDELLLPGESGDAALTALAEVLADSSRFRSARVPPGPMTRRLAKALYLHDLREGRPGTIEPWGITVEEYLLLAPSRRVLPADSLPPSLAAGMRLASFSTRLHLPEGFAADHRAVGILTPGGVIGPVSLAPGATVVEIAGLRPSGAPVTVVAWEEAPPSGVALLPAGRQIGSEGLVEELARVSELLDEEEMLVIDLAVGDVAVRPLPPPGAIVAGG
jgi:hypothetical protein